MTDFESTLVTALRAESERVSMSTDINEGRRTLEGKLDHVDRRRRRWYVVGAVAAVAAVVVIVVGAFAWPRASTPAPPVNTSTPTPSPTTFSLQTQFLDPNVTGQLPVWVATAGASDEGTGYVVYDEQNCGTSPCPADAQLKIRVYSVAQMYVPGSTRMTIGPSYATYVAAWKSLVARGYGRITGQAPSLVGGRPATIMTVSMSKDLPGLTSCQNASDAPTDCFFPSKGRTYRLAIVDQGAGKPPTLLTESSNAEPAGEAVAAREFTEWIATVRFQG